MTAAFAFLLALICIVFGLVVGAVLAGWCRT